MCDFLTLKMLPLALSLIKQKPPSFSPIGNIFRVKKSHIYLGKGAEKNHQNLRHLAKRGGGVRILFKQKFYKKLWQGGVKTLHVKIFSP